MADDPQIHIPGRSHAGAVAAAKGDEVLQAYPLTRPVQKFSAGKVAGGDPYSEIGTTGLRQFGGYVLEEWLVQLTGRRAAWAYREMIDNDPVVGAILFAVEMLARGVNWRVEGGTGKGQGAERAEFIESCMHDMSHTWLDFVSEVLSMLGYGWSFHEIVYKRRLGYQAPRYRTETSPQALADRQLRSIAGDTEEDAAWEPASSEFKDGKIGWRKLSGRAQETLLRWHFNNYSGLLAMEQIDWHGGDHVIPVEKALLFRTKTTRKNPEGRSILRNAWTSYYKLINIQQIEAIGIERDLAGLPVVYPPENVDIYSTGYSQIRQEVENLVQAIRKDEDQGIVMPSAGWKLELLTTGGSRQVNTDDVIRRYEQRILSSVLADFLILGQDSMGSYAMVDIKQDLFGIAMDSVLGSICSVLNSFAIPRLLRLNGMSAEDPPRITCSSAGRVDLEQIGRFLQSVALAGGPIPWSQELMEELFREAGLPAVFEGGALETQGNAEGHVHTTGEGSGVQKRPGLEGANGNRVQGPRNDERLRYMPTRKSEPGDARDHRIGAGLTKAEQHEGAMIALYPNKKTAAALAQPDGEPEDELHLTLAYFGKASDLSDDDVAKIRRQLQAWADGCPRLDGRISGHAHFEEPGNCTVALVDSFYLAKKQGRLISELTNAGVEPSKKHGFQPHITLAYQHINPGPVERPVKFKAVSLVLGGRREDFPLAGDRSALAKAA